MKYIFICLVSLGLIACGGGGSSSSSSDPDNTNTVTLSSNGAQIIIELSQVSGQRWQGNYRIENTGATAPIKGIRIVFPVGLYDALAISKTPDQWDAITADPDSLIDASGIYELFTVTEAIDTNQTLEGITLAFDWLGSGAPSSQSFEIINL